MARLRVVFYIIILAAVWYVRNQHPAAKPAGVATPTPHYDDGRGERGDAIDQQGLFKAIETHARDVQVEGHGTVVKVLPDDTEGDRHQKFILRLQTGETVLVAHNIDIAPRVAGVKAGDEIFFKGYYVWSEQGGVVHWTHHDPGGRHVTGYLKLNGQVFQ